MTLITRLSTHYVFQGIGQGLLLSVITLFMVEKGLALWQVGFAFGTFGVSAALLELPLGATADRHGRIRVFRASQLVSIVGLLIAALSSSFVWILIAMACLGLTRALESGSVSAWEVEQLRRQGLGDRLSELLGRFQAVNALGIAMGALIGGHLPGWLSSMHALTPTSVNLLVAAALTAVHVLLLPLIFREGDQVAPPDPSISLGKQIQTALKLATDNASLRSVLGVGFVFGLVMSNLEAYWQPQLQSLLQEQGYALFGWIATGYFASAALGPALFSIVSARLRCAPETAITVLLILVSPLLWCLASSPSVAVFALFYCLFIATLVCINIPAQVITNEQTEDAMRSTVQSVFSLTLQLGGALSAFGLSWVVEHFGISRVWQGLAVSLLVVAGLRLLAGWRQHRTTPSEPRFEPPQTEAH